MKKIVILPLDERPCTYEYPARLASMCKGVNAIVVPKNLMGVYKKPGDVKKISEFIYKECMDADYAVLALDSLLYGGIVPSRLHYEKKEDLMKLLDVLKDIKKVNPNIKIFAYQLIMRCPRYSSNSEEPDYYALCGSEIFNINYLTHLKELGALSKEDEEKLTKCKKFIEDNNYQRHVDDYVNRRNINRELNVYTLKFVEEGVIDFLIIPQDDSAPYGITAKDQMFVRNIIAAKHLESKVFMYPDADAVTNVLLARAINDLNNKKPNVFVYYSTCNAGNIIPLYEDRPVSESIKYQIMAAGGRYCNDAALADMYLMVNLPLKDMKEAHHLYDCLHRDVNPGEDDLAYTVGRNMVEFIEHIKYCLNQNITVGIADIAYANGSDSELVKMLYNNNLLFKVDGYAGWNTSANTLGTVIPLTMIHKQYGTSQEFLNFMGMRYVEDCGYQANVRFDVYDKYKNSNGWGDAGGINDGPIVLDIRHGLENYANSISNDEYSVELVDHYQPWARFFETFVDVKVIKK